MKLKAGIITFVSLFAFIITAQAQQPTSAAESADQLRLQLIDVQAKEEALRARAQQLDEALKPENIERSLAGVGSTRPEELRESRRRQLQIERDGITAQLKVLEANRTRLEAAIRDAETRAYHDSARGPSPTNEMVVQSLSTTRWLIPGSVGAAVAGLLAGLFVRRRLRKRS